MVSVLEAMALLLEKAKRISMSIMTLKKFFLYGFEIIVFALLSLTTRAQSIDDTLSSVNSNVEMSLIVLKQQYSEKEYQKTHILSQEDFHSSNTVYVLKYKFLLNSNIIIPEGCVLRFEGGTISGSYTLVGNNTIIE